MKFLTDNVERHRFYKFLVVGVTGTVVDFGVMNFLVLLINVPLVWAQGISFTAAVINKFLWNRFWTYPDSRSKKVPTQIIQFALLSMIGILVRTPLITWLNRIILNFLNTSSFSFPIENTIISKNLALAVTIAIILFWNFFSNRYWTYGDVPIGAKGYPSTEAKTSTNQR